MSPRKVGRPVGSSRDNSLSQILTAARKLYAQQGYARTTVKDIALSVGMTPAALYTYFPSKADLYKATCDQAQDQLLEQYVQALEHGGSLREQLARIFQVALATDKQDKSYVALLAAIPLEANRDAELAALMLDQQNATRMLLTKMFADGQARGEISTRATPGAQAMTLVGALAGIALLQNSSDESDLTLSLEIFTDLINSQLFQDI